MENTKFYVPVHAMSEVKDLAGQVAFYKQALLQNKIYDYAKDFAIKRHVDGISGTRDGLITDIFGPGDLLELMKLGFVYEELVIATEEIWQEAEEAKEMYRLKLDAAKVEPDVPLEVLDPTEAQEAAE